MMNTKTFCINCKYTTLPFPPNPEKCSACMKNYQIEKNITKTPKEYFYDLVKKGYKLIRLNGDLKPISKGWNIDGFVYETQYVENQNYGIVPGSTHIAKNGESGKLLLVDFDIKEKYTDEKGVKLSRVIPEAKNTLDIVKSGFYTRDVYAAVTKSGGLHIGILSNEGIRQTVALLQHKECEKLRIDIRTEIGYVVAIAPKYQIFKVPEKFDSVESDFQEMMAKHGFLKTSQNITKSGNASGSLSEINKQMARKVLDTLDVSVWDDLGTEKVGTHDCVVFWAMSCKSRNISLDEAIEKIMYILNQFETSKNNSITEREIANIYNVNYDNFTNQKNKEISDESNDLFEKYKKCDDVNQVEKIKKKLLQSLHKTGHNNINFNEVEYNQIPKSMTLEKYIKIMIAFRFQWEKIYNDDNTLSEKRLAKNRIDDLRRVHFNQESFGWLDDIDQEKVDKLFKDLGDKTKTKKEKKTIKEEINKIQENGNVKITDFDDEVSKEKTPKEIVDEITTKIMLDYSFSTLEKSNKILMWTGKIYSETKAKSKVKELAEKRIDDCTEHDRNEVLNKIKARTYTDIDSFDSDPNTITVESGILALDTLELNKHTPTNLTMVLLPVEYHTPKFEIHDETIFADIEKNLENTLFYKSLKLCFTINDEFRKEDFETVLEMMASVFVKRHIDSKAFMNLGSGENGKSVFLGYIESLLGSDNVSHIPLQDIASDKFASSKLVGMSANIFTDLERNELRDSGKIKAITDGEGIFVQEKHQDGFTLLPFAKLMFSCNKFPKVYDQSQGFFRRWIIIKWDRDFENDPKRIEYLREKLAENQEEKNLVFSCLVRIANRLNKVGKFSHSKKWEEVQREWNANADPIDDFVSNYIVDSESSKSKRETYQFYKKIMISKQEVPLGMGRFSKAFAEYHEEDFTRIDNVRSRVWLNIDFKVPKQANFEDFDRS